MLASENNERTEMITEGCEKGNKEGFLNSHATLRPVDPVMPGKLAKAGIRIRAVRI